MKRGVAITGMGIISALGSSVTTNFQSLLNGKSGIGNISHIKTQHAKNIKVGEVSKTNQELLDDLNLGKNGYYTRTALLGITAAREAVADAGILDIDKFTTGLISATSVGGMDTTEIHYNDLLNDKKKQPYIKTHHCGDSTQKIADYLGIKDYVTTISTACSSAANAIMMGARMIRSGKLDRVVVGGTDSLSKFTINGFNTLLILSDEVCKPFDKNRKGLNLGEGAAYLVLESDRVVAGKNKKVLAYVSGYANANDAFHQTASSENGEGAFLAMSGAIEVAGLNDSEISYVNVHGTATPNNDLSESRALLRIFGKELPPFSSTKAYTGHTLAAAGSLEAVFSVLAIQNSLVFPNLNFTTAIESEKLIPETEIREFAINHVLSNSFGFGGNCTSLIFSKE